MNNKFLLHPQLKKDCLNIGKLSLCRVLMANDSLYPWFILVPEVENVSEIYELKDAQQRQLIKESNHFSRCIMSHFQGEKLNIAALGNVVPQLHIHHIVRYKKDASWPAPVWGTKKAVPFSKGKAEQRIAEMQQIFSTLEGFRKNN